MLVARRRSALHNDYDARVFNDLTVLPRQAKGCVVALGNFDGVHRGHQKILAVARAEADVLGRRAGVLTFDPHPRLFFNPNMEAFELTPFAAKAEHISEEGIDCIFVAQFNAAFAAMSAERFIESVLVKNLAVAHVVVGEDYRFGRDRGGSVAMLKELGEAHGFGVTAVAPFKDGAGIVCSSTRVRAALCSGRPDLAIEILGRPWEVRGRVAATGPGVVSLPVVDYQRPLPGIYAVRISLDTELPAAMQRSYDTIAWVMPRDRAGGIALHIACELDGIPDRMLRVQFLGSVKYGWPRLSPDTGALEAGTQ